MPRLEESNKTAARGVKMYSNLPPLGRRVWAEPFAEVDAGQFLPVPAKSPLELTTSIKRWELVLTRPARLGAAERLVTTG